MRKFLVALLALCAAPAMAQSVADKAIPRTPEGRPDFQGGWENRWLTPLEKTGALTQLSVTQQQADTIVASVRKMAKALGELANDPEAGDPDAHSLAVVRGEYRTRMIVEPADGMLPYTPEGQKAAMQQQAWFTQRVITGRGEGPEDRLTWERCLAGMGQAPMLYGWAVAAFRQIVQTKDAVVIHSEGGGETRIIRIGGKPLPTGMNTFIGDSVAHWDGDTLVVETTGFRKDDQFRMFVSGRPIMVGVNSKVVERFARVSGAELNYRFTVEDPAIYAKPWLAEYSLIPAKGKMFEFACHEGNYGLPNILSGQREIERRKAAAATAPPK
jgi:hypothetical protein